MAWIESHQSLLTHRKTARLSRTLKISKVTAIGHLMAFWWWCLDNADDGDLRGIDTEDISDGAAWEGDPKEFLDGMVYAGFVDDVHGDLNIHDWMEYAGKLVIKRKSDADRKRAARHPSDGAGCPADIQRTSSGHPSDGAGTDRQTDLTDRQTDRGRVAKSAIPLDPLRVPPSIEHCRIFEVEAGLPPGTADEFHAHYEMKGWKVPNAGKLELMESWQGGMRNWLQRQKRFDKRDAEIAAKANESPPSYTKAVVKREVVPQDAGYRRKLREDAEAERAARNQVSTAP